jgi:hypothetical protein
MKPIRSAEFKFKLRLSQSVFPTQIKSHFHISKYPLGTLQFHDIGTIFCFGERKEKW